MIHTCVVLILVLLVAKCSSTVVGVTCKEILAANPAAPSGIYNYQLLPKGVIQVYCEMGLNGGGYTFLDPALLSILTNDQLQVMITDGSSLLMRIRRYDGAQPYIILKQLPQYGNISLKFDLSSNVGYNTPVNSAILGLPYLYVGFLPIINASNNNMQGIAANGVDITFQNCDQNPNSYIALFPNFAEINPSLYGLTDEYPFINNFFANAVANPSGRVMPEEFFLFTEFHFGGCGCYSQTDSRLSSKCILGTTVGFR